MVSRGADAAGEGSLANVVHALRRRPGPTGPGFLTALAALMALTAVLAISAASGATDRALSLDAPPLGLVLPGGLALIAVLAIAIFNYDATAVLGFALIGIVFFEPGLPDVVFAVLIAVAAVTGRLRVDRIPSLIAILLSLFLAVSLVSFVDTLDTILAVRFFAITTYLVLLAVWLTAYVDSPERLRPLVIAYVAGAVAMSAVSSLALFASFPGSDLLIYAEYSRIKGLFKDPNVFGPFLIPALLIVIEELMKPRLIRAPRMLKISAIGILALGIVLSYSRAAWLNAAVALGAMLMVLMLRRSASRRVVGFLALIAVVGAFLVAIVAVTGSADFLRERAQLHQYDAQRLGAQRTGIALVAQHPLGIGPGQFDVAVDYAAHSLYVRALTEQGVLGLAVVLLLVISTWGHAARNVVLGNDTFGLGSATLFAAWCGIVVNSLVVDTLHWRHLWILAGFVWIGATLPRLQSSLASTQRLDLRPVK